MACFNPLNPLNDINPSSFFIFLSLQEIEHVPVALFLFQSRHAQELVDGLFRVIHLHLFGIVVFIFDPDISRFIVVRIFIFEIVAITKASQSRTPRSEEEGEGGGDVLLIARVLHKIVVVGHFKNKIKSKVDLVSLGCRYKIRERGRGRKRRLW